MRGLCAPVLAAVLPYFLCLVVHFWSIIKNGHIFIIERVGENTNTGQIVGVRLGVIESIMRNYHFESVIGIILQCYPATFALCARIILDADWADWTDFFVFLFVRSIRQICVPFTFVAVWSRYVFCVAQCVNRTRNTKHTHSNINMSITHNPLLSNCPHYRVSLGLVLFAIYDWSFFGQAKILRRGKSRINKPMPALFFRQGR